MHKKKKTLQILLSVRVPLRLQTQEEFCIFLIFWCIKTSIIIKITCTIVTCFVNVMYMIGVIVIYLSL